MNQEIKLLPEKRDIDEGVIDFGTLIALGMSLGTAGGILLGNIGMGICLGLNAATIVNAFFELRQGKKGARTGLVISVMALLVVLCIWFIFGSR